MRLITYTRAGQDAASIGVRLGARILELGAAARIAGEAELPARMKDLLAAGPAAMERARRLAAAALAAPERYAAALLEQSAVRFLPTVPDADKFLCVGKNYRQHLEEVRRNDLLTETPQEPTAFVKLNSCLVGHEARVARPQGIVRLDYEPELVCVIGRRALGV